MTQKKEDFTMKLLTLVATFSILSACSQLPIGAADNAPLTWMKIEPEPFTYQDQPEKYKSTELEIVLTAGNAMELKFTMQKHDTVVYQWQVQGDAKGLSLTEFHGHTSKPDGSSLGTLVFYKKHKDSQESGSLTAAFAGDHGWYFENDSDKDISIQLTAAGWYESVREIPVPR
ncbi:MAG: hypothetical protein ACJAWI_001324 [Marinomonas primoryensis]|jgi:hypothetical protein